MLKKTIHKLAAVHEVFTQVHDADLLVAALPCDKVLSAIQEVIELSCGPSRRHVFNWICRIADPSLAALAKRLGSSGCTTIDLEAAHEQAGVVILWQPQQLKQFCRCPHREWLPLHAACRQPMCT